jgi:hypothetical protein
MENGDDPENGIIVNDGYGMSSQVCRECIGLNLE